MALTSSSTTNSLLPNKSLVQNQPLLPSPLKNASLATNSTKTVRYVQPISAVHASDSSKNLIVSDKLLQAFLQAATGTAAPAVTKKQNGRGQLEIQEGPSSAT
ncbi:hypothetical protein HAX54_011653 [Datura stramonium]|uniref:Uncharacterized protein n=1 Tax=Datura stramonium TaxID=4076 RepID=A0ABS8TL93_DATST|nr:hypothetical protein [Datura stramonium]